MADKERGTKAKGIVYALSGEKHRNIQRCVGECEEEEARLDLLLPRFGLALAILYCIQNVAG